jgi:hypothetical protein
MQRQQIRCLRGRWRSGKKPGGEGWPHTEVGELWATRCLFVWLVADGWCWFVLREKYCWLVADGWFVVREKYCWLVADKPNEQGNDLGFGRGGAGKEGEQPRASGGKGERRRTVAARSGGEARRGRKTSGARGRKLSSRGSLPHPREKGREGAGRGDLGAPRIGAHVGDLLECVCFF